MTRMRVGISALLLLGAAFGLAAEEGFVVVCPVEGMIDDGAGVLVERAMREAQGAKAIIFEIDTPGGLLDSAIDITKTVLDAPCPTIAYIKGMGAISAGALISYSCKHMIMTPDTNIGAATPVIMSAEGMQPTSEKEVSFMRAKMRALAERNDHNPWIAEAMVDKDIGLYAYTDVQTGRQIVFAPEIEPESDAFAAKGAERRPEDNLQKAVDLIARAVKELSDTPNLAPKPAEPSTLDETEVAAEPDAESAVPEGNLPPGTKCILAKGKLLTLTPREAVSYGVIPTTANNLDEVMAFYGYTGCRKHQIVATWSEDLFRWLTNPMVSGLLLMLGVAGLYMEIKTPGFGGFGVIGMVCLALFFGSHYVIGLANWLDLLLVLSGLVLLGVEIFVVPGFGIFGVAGVCCLLFGLYLSLTHVTIPEYSWDYARMEDASLSMVVAVLSFGLFVYALVRAFPYTPMYRLFVQSYVEDASAGYTVQTVADRDTAVGLRGVALSMLRPAGRGRFGARTLQVMTRGDFIAEGTPIVIVEAEGNRYVVDAAPDVGANTGDVSS